MMPGEILPSTWALVPSEWEWASVPSEWVWALVPSVWVWVSVLLEWVWASVPLVWEWVCMTPSSTQVGDGDLVSMLDSTLAGVTQCSITLEVASTILFGVVATLAHLGGGEDQFLQLGQSSSSQEANMATVALSTALDQVVALPSRMGLEAKCKM